MLRTGLSFLWSQTPRPIVALAPMAGVTDASYRQLIKRIAPETIVFTEFLSTDAMHYGAEKTLSMLDFDPALERPFIVQVFGHEPAHFLTAAKIIEEMGADGIDINMGCPAAKVVSSCHGAALIKDADLAAELIHATKKSVRIPVSVKTRLGWDRTETLIPFCEKIVAAGADALSIHGRRFCDKFTGKADWDPIYALKRALPHVPIIGNGDIKSAEDALAKIGNLDGVMVGRGTFGNPWVMKEIHEALQSAKGPSTVLRTGSGQSTKNDLRTSDFALRTSSQKMNNALLSFAEKIPIILMHCELAVRLKGEKRGMLEMRRHLSSYVKGFDGAREMREKLVRVERLDEAKAILARAVSF